MFVEWSRSRAKIGTGFLHGDGLRRPGGSATSIQIQEQWVLRGAVEKAILFCRHTAKELARRGSGRTLNEICF